DQGVPGPALRESRLAHRTVSRLLVAATYDRPVDAHGRLALVLAGTVERQRFADPLAEVVMIPRSTDDLSVRVYAAAKAAARPLDGLGGELRAFGLLGVRPWEARASVRLELVDARLVATEVTGTMMLPTSSS